MASFNHSAETGLDFQLMGNTCVTLFWRRHILEESSEWLRDHGYHVVYLNAGSWSTDDDMRQGVGAALDFPDYYVGRSFAALNDCLGDVACYREYGIPAEASGLVLVLSNYDRFAALRPWAAQILLDIIGEQARRAMLFGHRTICLVHSNDPQIHFDPLAAMPVTWNPRESLASSRKAK